MSLPVAANDSSDFGLPLENFSNSTNTKELENKDDEKKNNEKKEEFISAEPEFLNDVNNFNSNFGDQNIIDNEKEEKKDEEKKDEEKKQLEKKQKYYKWLLWFVLFVCFLLLLSVTYNKFK